MYDFRDLDKFDGTEQFMSGEELSLNGIYLHKTIPGFITLTVKGREDYSRSLNAPELAGDGNMYLSSRVESKVLTVTFQLLSESPADLQEKFNLLKNALLKPEQKFSFRDEPDWHYVGTVTKLENTTEGRLNIIGTIEITCSDPFKHGDVKTQVMGASTQEITDNHIVTPVIPRKITFAFGSNTDKVTINKISAGSEPKQFITVNGGKRGFRAGDTLTIVLKDSIGCYVNGENKLTNVDLKSNFGDFVIASGDQLNATTNGVLSIEYEVTQL